METNNIDFKLWVEQPENYPTCLALRPYPREDVQKLFKGFNLLKAQDEPKQSDASANTVKTE